MCRVCECHTVPRQTQNKKWFIHPLLPSQKHSAWHAWVWGGRSRQMHNSDSAVPQQGHYQKGPQEWVALPIIIIIITFFRLGPRDLVRRARLPHNLQVICSNCIRKGKHPIIHHVLRKPGTQEPHLLIFANSFVVFHNHINAGGRVQCCSLQIKLQHLRQERITHQSRGVRLSEQSFSAIKVKSACSNMHLSDWED